MAPGGKTNPEQLFAGGYAACFENALLRVAREAKTPFADDDVEVTAIVGLDRNSVNAFVLAAELAVTVTGVTQEQEQELVHRADAICPYSNAIRGNVPVKISVSVR